MSTFTASTEISTSQQPTTPKSKCGCSTLVPIGVSDGSVPDKSMTSTSVLVNSPGRKYTGPNQARLNNKQSAKGIGAWEPKDDEASLQIDFDGIYDLKEIRTQGSPNGKKYTARFFLFYTIDGKTWHPVFRVSSFYFNDSFHALTIFYPLYTYDVFYAGKKLSRTKHDSTSAISVPIKNRFLLYQTHFYV